jgi:hypothetical protein
MAAAGKRRARLGPLMRAVTETAFIIFLFYSNLLMGEFTRTNGAGKTFATALDDVITPTNFGIAVTSALLGYLVVEFLRRRV